LQAFGYSRHLEGSAAGKKNRILARNDNVSSVSNGGSGVIGGGVSGSAIDKKEHDCIARPDFSQMVPYKVRVSL
jgi:hypothetical protein